MATTSHSLRRRALWNSKKRSRSIMGDDDVASNDYEEESLGLDDRDNEEQPIRYSRVRLQPLVKQRQPGFLNNNPCYELSLPMTLGRRKLSQWWWKACPICCHVADDSDSDDSDNKWYKSSGRKRKHWKPSTYCSPHCRPLKNQVKDLPRAMFYITVNGELELLCDNPELVHIATCSSSEKEGNDKQHGGKKKGRLEGRNSRSRREGSAVCKIISIGEEGTTPCMKFQLELVPERKIPGIVTVEKKKSTSTFTYSKHVDKKRNQRTSPIYSSQSQSQSQPNSDQKKAKTRQHDSMTVSPSPMTDNGWRKRSDESKHLSNHSWLPVDFDADADDDDDPRQTQIPRSPSSVLPHGPSQRQRFDSKSTSALSAMSPPSINRSGTRKQRPRTLQFSLHDDDDDDDDNHRHETYTKNDSASLHPETMSSGDTPQSQEPKDPQSAMNYRCDNSTRRVTSRKQSNGRHVPISPFPKKPFVLPSQSSTPSSVQSSSSEGCQSQPCLNNYKDNDNLAAAMAPHEDSITAQLEGSIIPTQPKENIKNSTDEDVKMATRGQTYSAPSTGTSGASSVLSLPCYVQEVMSNQTPIIVPDHRHGVSQQHHGDLRQEQLDRWERTASSKATRALLAMVVEKNKGKNENSPFWLPALFDDCREDCPAQFTGMN